MFKQNPYNRLIKHNKVTGLEIVFLPDGGSVFNISTLKRKGSKLEVEYVKTQIDTWNLVKKELNTSVPLAIVFNGKGILHKKTTINHSDDDNNNLHKILASAKVQDFYLQVIHSENSEGFISVIRKEIVDDFIKTIANDGFYPLSVTLGPLILNAVIPLIKTHSSITEIGNCTLIVNDNTITTFETNNNDILDRKIYIANEEVKQQAAIAFAAAFRYLFIPKSSLETNITRVLELRKESEQQKLFKTFSWSIMFFFLVALLGNFLLFNHFNKKNNALKEKYNLNKSQLDYISEMKLKINEKQSFIEKSGLKFASRTSFYADRIALDLPETIRLIDISVNPIEKIIKPEEPIIFTHKVISVKGSCKKSTELNNWIRVLNENDWIKDVLVINYKQENAREPGEFEIKIVIA